MHDKLYFLQMKLETLQAEIQEIVHNSEQLKKNYNSLVEQRHTVCAAQKFYASVWMVNH